MQDGRQKGEVQLAFTFQPFDPSSSSPHDSQSNLAAFQAQHPSPSSRAGSARTTADDNSPQKLRGMPEPALVSELPRDDGLGPLGQSFMTLEWLLFTSLEINNEQMSRPQSRSADACLGTVVLDCFFSV